METIIYIILAILLVAIIVIIVKYNNLVKLYNTINRASADIEVYLNKRFDLMPNLVECVKGYSKHEEGTLEKITSLRSEYNNKDHKDIKDANEMNNELTKYLAVVEAYPDLKANSQYLDLQNQLRNIEDELENARRNYNNIVNRYNVAIDVVPSNLVADIFGFKKASLFKLEAEKKENINVKI